MARVNGKLTDPVESGWSIGNSRDTVYFDYYVDRRRKRVLLHAILDCETGHFCQNLSEPEWAPFAEASDAASDLVFAGWNWFLDNRARLNQREADRTRRKFAAAVAEAIR